VYLDPAVLDQRHPGESYPRYSSAPGSPSSAAAPHACRPPCNLHAAHCAVPRHEFLAPPAPPAPSCARRSAGDRLRFPTAAREPPRSRHSRRSPVLRIHLISANRRRRGGYTARARGRAPTLCLHYRVPRRRSHELTPRLLSRGQQGKTGRRANRRVAARVSGPVHHPAVPFAPDHGVAAARMVPRDVDFPDGSPNDLRLSLASSGLRTTKLVERLPTTTRFPFPTVPFPAEHARKRRRRAYVLPESAYRSRPHARAIHVRIHRDVRARRRKRVTRVKPAQVSGRLGARGTGLRSRGLMPAITSRQRV